MELKVKTRVVPIVVGALGTIPKGLVCHLESTGSDSKDYPIRNSTNPPTGSRLLRLQEVTRAAGYQFTTTTTTTATTTATATATATATTATTNDKPSVCMRL